MEGLNPNGSGVNSGPKLNSDSGRSLGMDVQSSVSDSESYLSLQNGDSNCWGGGNGWPDLAIYTPGSNFQ